MKKESKKTSLNNLRINIEFLNISSTRRKDCSTIKPSPHMPSKVQIYVFCCMLVLGALMKVVSIWGWECEQLGVEDGQ